MRARNLQVPGADQTFARLLASNSEPVQRAAWESSRYFVLAALMRQARQDALSTELPAAGRVRAVRALRGGNFDGVAPVLETRAALASAAGGGSVRRGCAGGIR